MGLVDFVEAAYTATSTRDAFPDGLQALSVARDDARALPALGPGDDDDDETPIGDPPDDDEDDDWDDDDEDEDDEE